MPNPFIGTPYRYGGNSRNGIDCSSLIQQSYAKIGINYLERLKSKPR